MLANHPESPARLASINAAISERDWGPNLEQRQAREIDAELFVGVHPRHYLDRLAELEPGAGLAHIDADTSINNHSLRAARLAAGGPTWFRVTSRRCLGWSDEVESLRMKARPAASPVVWRPFSPLTAEPA